MYSRTKSVIDTPEKGAQFMTFSKKQFDLLGKFSKIRIKMS